jgi:hypothetical protein
VLALEVSRHHRATDDDTLFRAVRSELADTVGVAPNEILLLRQNTIPGRRAARSSAERAAPRSSTERWKCSGAGGPIAGELAGDDRSARSTTSS